MLPKNRIRLSRALRSQITPYPNASTLVKRAVFLSLGLIIAGVYFFVTNDKPQTNPDSIPKQILGEQQKAPSPQFQIYRVKRGDTLFNLSQKFDVSWQTLAEVNNLQEPYVLRVDQEIKIPKK